MEYDVIIVGGGASGLMAAIAAARQGSKVLVIEQKDRSGKKILATGNGKCNYTNLHQTAKCYRSDDSEFAMKVLSYFDATDTIRFFTELGIYPKERDGYLYPNSEQASSVVAVLLLECERLKISFRYHETVKEIRQPYYTVITNCLPVDNSKSKGSSKMDAVKKSGKKSESENIPVADNRSREITQNTQNEYTSKRLILAAGGCASPKLGSDGSGYRLAQSLGHRLIKPLPALVQLKSPEKYFKTISGVRTIAAVTLSIEGGLSEEETGEVLFTDYGISGIPILQLSRFAAKALDNKKIVALILDYLPGLPKKELLELLKLRIKQNPEKNLEEMLIGLLNNKLSYLLILETGLDPYLASRKLTAQELERLADHMKRFQLRISDTNSFENAQVCAGGVATKEIQGNTMESKIIQGLYLCGEIIDVDGTCGGYNLQWAWSSGYLAGSNAGKQQ